MKKNIDNKTKNSKIKVVLYSNKRVVITNYLALKEILENEIIVDKITIFGTNLKLKAMDNYMIEVVGKVEGVKYEEL